MRTLILMMLGVLILGSMIPIRAGAEDPLPPMTVRGQIGTPLARRRARMAG